MGKNVLAECCKVHGEFPTSECKPDISDLLLSNVVKVINVFKARPTNEILFLSISPVNIERKKSFIDSYRRYMSLTR